MMHIPLPSPTLGSRFGTCLGIEVRVRYRTVRFIVKGKIIKNCLLSTTENGRRSAAMKTPINLVIAFAFRNSQTGIVEIVS